MGSSSTLIYTAELILCFTICVLIATRHNIHMYPSKVDKQTTFTSTARDHAVQDTEEMTGPSKLPSTTAETLMLPACSQTAPVQTRSGRIVKPPD